MRAICDVVWLLEQQTQPNATDWLTDWLLMINANVEGEMETAQNNNKQR